MPVSKAKGTSETSTKYLGVRVAGYRYRAQISTGNTELNAGRWDTAEEAAIAFDRAALHLGLDRALNFPAESRALGPASPQWLREEAQRITRIRRGLTLYFGVEETSPGRWSMLVRDAAGRQWTIRQKTELAAAEAYDRAVRGLGLDLPLNFPGKALPPATLIELRQEALRTRKANAGSQYRGVRRAPGGGYQAKIRYERWVLHLGLFASAVEAARRYDEAAWDAWGDAHRLNFAAPRRPPKPASLEAMRRELREAYKETTTSQYRGVSWNAASARWRAAIGVDNKRIILGEYDSEHEAGHVYDQAALRLHEKPFLNFPEEAEEKRKNARKRRRA